MSEEKLVKVAFQAGRYEGELHAPEDTGIEAVHDGRVIAAARLTHCEDGASGTRVSIDLPADIMSDGVQVVSLRSTVSGAVLDRITFLAGHILDDDIRAEITLLRDELEMLKRAFRRHVSTESG
ncbi:MAG: hypothetical protein HLUCCO18_01345 [Rhodobacteraceae bacterium HLUCCO18]|nr:MAG: hypothetical protein HLUCCO18_01345 [Rhodobacteraceae bacterium HLUCCO18]